MTGDVHERETAVDIATDYAEEECVGMVNEVLDVEREDGSWVVAFETHTFDHRYEHRVRMNRVGNVFAHERASASH